MGSTAGRSHTSGYGLTGASSPAWWAASQVVLPSAKPCSKRVRGTPSRLSIRPLKRGRSRKSVRPPVVTEVVGPIAHEPILRGTRFARVDVPLTTGLGDDADVTQPLNVGICEEDDVAGQDISSLDRVAVLVERDHASIQRIELGQDADVVQALQHVARAVDSAVRRDALTQATPGLARIILQIDFVRRAKQRAPIRDELRTLA